MDLLRSRAVTPHLGVELDTQKQLIEFSDQELDEVQRLAADKCIVVVRNVIMSKQEQAVFARRLGDPLTKPNNPNDIPKELVQIKADQNSKYAAGELWHSDVSSDSKPPGLSMLRMEITPSSGGDTVFANMYQAFDSLSVSMKAFLQKLKALHVPKAHYLYTSGMKKMDELESSLHPVVRLHPLNNRKALFVNAAFVEKIEGLTFLESKAVLRMIYNHVAYSINHQCRIRWEPNTVVFWDNRCVQHYASFDYFPALRLGYRATIRGEKPVPAKTFTN
ncbi:MAG: taurine dioxygenase [Porticoccaceae bacterium]|nr:taurine dioxygenase [Porticoccaceae bacterium]